MGGLPPTDFDKRLGVRLKDLRKERNLTQRDVADSMGVSSAQMQKYEKGTNCMSASAVQKIARFMQVSPMAFYDPEAAVFDPDLAAAATARQSALVHAREIITLLGGALS